MSSGSIHCHTNGSSTVALAAQQLLCIRHHQAPSLTFASPYPNRHFRAIKIIAEPIAPMTSLTPLATVSKRQLLEKRMAHFLCAMRVNKNA